MCVGKLTLRLPLHECISHIPLIDLCSLSIGIKMLLWHIFNWYLHWLSPLFGFCFCFRQKGGEHFLFYPFVDSLFRTKRGRKKFIDLVLLLPLYWWLFLCIKKGRRFCFVLVFTPLLMIDKKGEKDFEFVWVLYMHIYVLHILRLI